MSEPAPFDDDSTTTMPAAFRTARLGDEILFGDRSVPLSVTKASLTQDDATLEVEGVRGGRFRISWNHHNAPEGRVYVERYVDAAYNGSWEGDREVTADSVSLESTANRRPVTDVPASVVDLRAVTVGETHTLTVATDDGARDVELEATRKTRDLTQTTDEPSLTVRVGFRPADREGCGYRSPSITVTGTVNDLLADDGLSGRLYPAQADVFEAKADGEPAPEACDVDVVLDGGRVHPGVDPSDDDGDDGDTTITLSDDGSDMVENLTGDACNDTESSATSATSESRADTESGGTSDCEHENTAAEHLPGPDGSRRVDVCHDCGNVVDDVDRGRGVETDGGETTTPHNDHDAERDAIRELLRSESRFADVHVLTYFGGDPLVALVKRDKAPSTEHPTEGEAIAVVEWLDGDYSTTAATGDFGSSWSVEEDPRFVESREAALDAALTILSETSTDGGRERWFEYGEPVGDERVEATVRTVYPNSEREDDVRQGTVAMDALALLDDDSEIVPHVHDDRSVLLGGLGPDAEDRLLQTFEETSADGGVVEEDVGEVPSYEAFSTAQHARVHYHSNRTDEPETVVGEVDDVAPGLNTYVATLDADGRSIIVDTEAGTVQSSTPSRTTDLGVLLSVDLQHERHSVTASLRGISRDDANALAERLDAILSDPDACREVFDVDAPLDAHAHGPDS